MRETIHTWLTEAGLSTAAAKPLGALILMCGAVVLSVAAHYVARTILVRFVTRVSGRTRTVWDDIIVQEKALGRAAHLLPAIIMYYAAQLVLTSYPQVLAVVVNAVYVYAILVGIWALSAVLNTVQRIYQTLDISNEIHITGLLQAAKIVAAVVGVVLMLSLLLDKSPVYLLSGLGAMTAVLLLIFKDSLLGLTAGFLLTSNRMIARGDWIEMPKYGANGDVMDVTLTSVKVRNWDKTITTIPTYALISESFKNWRGMQESGGRRMARSIYIDMNSVAFCTPDMLERFRKIEFIADYIEKRQKEIEEYNRARNVDESVVVNGRRMTNIGTLRAYIAAYLRNHPLVKQDMTLLVRHLQPSEHGIPIQIYAFCADTRWAHYEAFQADVLDHILAVIPQFDLRVFQRPSGLDLQTMDGGRGVDD
jgi:miniconductance mechanosensitive channel